MTVSAGPGGHDEVEPVEAAAGDVPSDTPLNQRRFVRAVNEGIRRIGYPLPEAWCDFMCECARERCFAVVPLTVAEWTAATAEAGYFVIRPDHLWEGEEAVVAGDRYAVVRVRGREAQVR